MRKDGAIFFCGIGGAGMSPLARLMARRGHKVIGSDRSHDLGRNKKLFHLLLAEGIRLVPQDGSGVNEEITTFVVTRAVEPSIPDIKRALELNIPIRKRPRFMAEVFRETRNVAIGGTSGKSTTTAMIGHIMRHVGSSPTIMNGAVMRNGDTNFVNGSSDLAIFEADESDGFEDVISVCPSSIAVVTNITLDHFEISELREMFSGFVEGASHGAVINADCPNSTHLIGKSRETVTFGSSPKADFSLASISPNLNIAGDHNKLNALAAIAGCSLLGVPVDVAREALSTFTGIKRRLEVIGVSNGVTVIDDFASNPGKIAASLKAVQEGAKRIFVVFQPHGFQPTKMMRDGYIETFASLLRKDDVLIMPDIFYVGGTANLVNGEVVTIPKDISSEDITSAVTARGRLAYCIPDRAEIPRFIQERVAPGDTVLVMGSRDESLSEFAEGLRGALV
jgi:UDP-N-acetylmuramate--alanine ligase